MNPNIPGLGTGIAQRGANTLQLRQRYRDEYMMPYQMGAISGPMMTFEQWAQQMTPQQPIAIPVGAPQRPL